MAISRINPSTLLSKVRLLMRVADLSKPVSFTFIGLSTNASWLADERKNIPAKIVTVSCECQLRCRFSQ